VVIDVAVGIDKQSEQQSRAHTHGNGFERDDANGCEQQQQASKQSAIILKFPGDVQPNVPMAMPARA
jgi:hypothetical protein